MSLTGISVLVETMFLLAWFICLDGENQNPKKWLEDQNAQIACACESDVQASQVNHPMGQGVPFGQPHVTDGKDWNTAFLPSFFVCELHH